MAEASRVGETIFRGIPVSSGVCRGKVFLLEKTECVVSRRTLAEYELQAQVEQLEQALVRTRQQILEVQRQVTEGMGAGDASIFEAHLLVLDDRTLMDEVLRLIQEEKINVEFAFQSVADKYANALSEIDDEYLRERAADLRDVSARVLNNLFGRETGHEWPALTEPCVVISNELTPSMTAQLDRQKVLGFATDTGSKTSHTAILARSMQIPAVVGLGNISRHLRTGDDVLLDGFNGLVVQNPTDPTLFEYGQVVRRQVDLVEKLREIRDQPTITLDGKRIVLSANVEQTSDTDLVAASGAEGVGLFRTEFLFLNRDTLPTEEEQFQAYRQVAAALKPQPVVIRTVDLGGDKFVTHLHLPKELNPFLGWRAIRFCLQERELFRAQLRAILRASVEGNVKVMYPMVSGLGELMQANALLAECQAELRAANVSFDPNLEIGAMIEIPSAALTAVALAKHTRFFSIGTNDLIQYALAVDRLNEKIAHLYEPAHPAILRLIKLTIDAAHAQGNWVGVCGEMASDPALVPLLIGLGVDELSVVAPMVPQIKFLIRRLNYAEVRQLANQALDSESPADNLARSQAVATLAAPSLFGREA